jgi:hypothetical protein
MESRATSPDAKQRRAVAFLTKLIRLQREVSELGHQLDRIESEMREALCSVKPDRSKVS